MKVLKFTLLFLSPFAISSRAQVHKTPKASPPQPAAAQVAPADAAHSAVMLYLKALRIAELPEGKDALSAMQWVPAIANRGKNFYSRPTYTSAESLYSKLYATDVAGVFGYKELFSMKGVNGAGQTKTFQYLVIAFQNRHTGEWKILDSYDDDDSDGGDSSFDFARNMEFFKEHLGDTSITSAKDNYLIYAHWAFLNGSLNDAASALQKAKSASGQSSASRFDPMSDLQITVLISVLDEVMAP